MEDIAFHTIEADEHTKKEEQGPSKQHKHNVLEIHKSGIYGTKF